MLTRRILQLLNKDLKVHELDFYALQKVLVLFYDGIQNFKALGIQKGELDPSSLPVVQINLLESTKFLKMDVTTLCDSENTLQLEQPEFLHLNLLQSLIHLIEIILKYCYATANRNSAIALLTTDQEIEVYVICEDVKKVKDQLLSSIHYMVFRSSDVRNIEMNHEKRLLELNGYEIIHYTVPNELLDSLLLVLEYNRSYLSNKVLEKHRIKVAPKHEWLVPSFLVPIATLSPQQEFEIIQFADSLSNRSTNYLLEASKLCDYCFDKQGVKKCANCKQKQYCSRECQSTDWKLHKSICEKPTQVKAITKPSRYILVSLLSTNTNQQKTKCGLDPLVSTIKEDNFILKKYKDRDFIIKVQIPLLGELGTCTITDRNKDLLLKIEERDHCATFIDIVSEKGALQAGQGRVKGYFKAKIEATHLKVLIDRLPPQNEGW